MYSMLEREASTKDQLIDSTRELLWERGYAATSPRAILGRAGVGQGSMYHHFAGKRQLAEAALGVTARELLEGAEAVLVEGSAFDRVRGYLLRRRDVLRGCPVGRMASDPDVLASPELRELVAATFEQIRTLLVAAFEQGIANGEFTAELDPAELSDTVLAVVQGGYVLARAAADPAAFDRAVRGAVALIAQARVEARS
jgi:TetR/AcrR family transcriptional regulator, transcriptional repressor for nem operon